MEITPEEFVSIMNRLSKIEEFTENLEGRVHNRAVAEEKHWKHIEENDKKRYYLQTRVKELEERIRGNKIIVSGVQFDQMTDRLLELENHDKRSLALIDTNRTTLSNIQTRLIEMERKKALVESTDHGKYQKLVELCKEHTSDKRTAAVHVEIKAALKELDA